MKKMIKLLSLVLALLMAAFCFTACGGDNSTKDKDAGKGDLSYVKEKGVLVVGITDFAPMDYQDEKGNWIGFDADMATKFAQSLGVKVKFVEINWANKANELSAKNIDCVWNGMTISDDVKAMMDVSNAYCNNAQVVVVPKDKADKYQTVEACKSLNFAVEAGSAGQTQAEANKFNFTEFPKQANAVMEVAAGTSDAAIIDSLMAAAMIGDGTGYPDLTYTVSLNSEEYGVGFRKGSDITAELNKFFEQCKKDGSMQEIAEKYGVQAALIK